MGWNSTLTRKTPLRAKAWRWKPKEGKIHKAVKTPKKPRNPMKRAGKKTRHWEACRAALKPKFERAGITVCEIQFTGCWHDNGLGFAHSKKRRNIGPGELEEVVLACNACHDTMEAWPEERMTAHVRAMIAARKTHLR